MRVNGKIDLAERVSRRVWRYRWWAAAAAVLLAVGAAWWYSRPGLVQITAFAGAMVYVDGVEHGTAPIHMHLSPGTHEIVIVSEGLEDYKTTVEVEPRSSFSLIAIPPSASLPRERSAMRFDGAALPLWPRGAVRRQDARHLRAEMYELFQGRLLVLDGDDNELDAVDFSAENRHFERLLGDTVLEKLAVGKTYRWGFELESGERALATFTVVPDLPAGELADLRTRIKDQQMARLFEIALLQHHGLHAAALETALRLGEDWPKQIVFGLAWRSLAKLELERSLTAGRIREQHDDAED